VTKLNDQRVQGVQIEEAAAAAAAAAS